MYEKTEKARSLIKKDDINAMNINTTPNVCVATLKTTIRKLQQGTTKQNKKQQTKKKHTQKNQERLKRILKLKEMCGKKGQATPVSYD